MATVEEVSATLDKNMPTQDVEAQLDDDKQVQPADFKGATLQLGHGDALSAPPEVEFEGAGLKRDRPGSAISRKSVSSISSRTSVNNKFVRSKLLAKNFFCRREGAFETAVEQCKANLKPEIDGELRGAWVLTEVDHWDNDKEKLVMLTDHSLIVNKYDFITLKVNSQKRIFLHMIDTVKMGDFIYPSNSLMWPREHGGVQALWNKGAELTFGQRWNPWCTDIPWITFAHHPIYYHDENERDTTIYNVDDFAEMFCQLIQQSYQSKNIDSMLNIEEGQIEIQTYASLSSMVFNQSHVGFCMDRGGVSF